MQTIEQTAESKLISDLSCPPYWCHSVCWQAASPLSSTPMNIVHGQNLAAQQASPQLGLYGFVETEERRTKEMPQALSTYYDVVRYHTCHALYFHNIVKLGHFNLSENIFSHPSIP